MCLNRDSERKHREELLFQNASGLAHGTISKPCKYTTHSFLAHVIRYMEVQCPVARGDVIDQVHT